MLPGLYDHVKGDLVDTTQERFDDEVRWFETLIAETSMTWEELRVIRDYTVNFNPAVTEQIRIETLRRRRGSEGGGAEGNGPAGPTPSAPAHGAVPA